MSNKPSAKVSDPRFQAYVDAAQGTRKRNAKKKQRGGEKMAPVFQGFTVHHEEKEIDFKFECGCFGTEHVAINNCMNCGRVICAREGERPCPFCGTLVFSDETLMDPDLLEQKIEEMRQKIGSQNWKPLLEKDKVVSSVVTTIDTQMFDLQTDWFDSELQEIFRETE